MDLSVVVPTLNGRDQLGRCLDAISNRAPSAECIVVNGPSADGTTGMIKARDDIDALVEISDRNVNVARNAGIGAASGDAIAFVGYDRTIDAGWVEAVESRLGDTADVVTGPTRGGSKGTQPDTVTAAVAGRSITYCNGANLAATSEVLDELDGFDEYLSIGGARDFSHRLAGMDFRITWTRNARVSAPCATDGGAADNRFTRHELYRSLAYQLGKNYGLRPSTLARSLFDGTADAVTTAVDVLRGSVTPSEWFGEGRDALAGLSVGYRDGLGARYRDRRCCRNPNGFSTRHDRAVCAYDWR
jgi:glycosyltransferase involved in cell wall biosynthesis